MTDTTREAFEAWFAPTFDDKPLWNPSRNCYIRHSHHMAWKGWQAATEQGKRQPLSDGDAKDAIPAGVLTAIRLAGLTLIQNQRGYRLEKFSDLVAQNNPICGNCDTPYPPGCKGQFKDDGDICMASGAAIASQKAAHSITATPQGKI